MSCRADDTRLDRARHTWLVLRACGPEYFVGWLYLEFHFATPLLAGSRGFADVFNAKLGAEDEVFTVGFLFKKTNEVEGAARHHCAQVTIAFAAQSMLPDFLHPNASDESAFVPWVAAGCRLAVVAGVFVETVR